MTDPKKNPDRDPAQAEELKDEALDNVAGGARRSGHDEDVEDLEVERYR